MDRPAAGFTLVEVLVALAIVAVALAAGVRAAAGVVDGAQRLADVTAAQWCADNQLTALKLSRQLPGVGDADFTCEQLGRSYSGTLRTQPTPNPNFRRVDAIVRNEAGQTLLTVSTVASRL
jgi:general secretion pathway protein I